jgi:HSP20 family molecular chaperone IbpA
MYLVAVRSVLQLPSGIQIRTVRGEAVALRAAGRNTAERPRRKGRKKFPLRITEKMNIFKTVMLPLEVKPEGVRAILKNSILEVILPKAKVVKKVKVEVKPF